MATVHDINSRIVFLTLSDVLCVRCQYIGIHSRNVFLKRSGLILQKKIRKFAQNRQTNKQTNKQTENSKTEATLSPVVWGSAGNAGQFYMRQTFYSYQLHTILPFPA